MRWKPNLRRRRCLIRLPLHLWLLHLQDQLLQIWRLRYRSQQNRLLRASLPNSSVRQARRRPRLQRRKRQSLRRPLHRPRPWLEPTKPKVFLLPAAPIRLPQEPLRVSSRPQPRLQNRPGPLRRNRRHQLTQAPIPSISSTSPGLLPVRPQRRPPGACRG
jgi:hypothetical protein